MSDLRAPELTVVIPTFNECANIRPLFALLDTALCGTHWEAVFVDDDSPDGTAAEIRQLAAQDGRARLLHRIGRRGLAGACIEGILSSAASFCAVIDADLQHDETKLGPMLEALQRDPQLDLVIGSRRAGDGSDGTGLTPVRKWGSDRATALARRLLRITATDPMSGFFMLRRTSFNPLAPDLQRTGFKILADMLSLSRGRWKISEIGYTFRQRQHGDSKLDTTVALEFLGLLVARLTGGLMSIRFVLFGMVGLSGMVIQMVAVGLTLLLWPDHFAAAQAVGVFVAMNTNFYFNNLLTYADRSLRGADMLRGLVSFYGVCGIGAAANIGVATVVYDALPYWAIASAVGAVIGAIWNFGASATVTWKAR